MRTFAPVLALVLGVTWVCTTASASILPSSQLQTVKKPSILNTVDLTREPKQKGSDVVNAVIHLIERSRIFPGDNRFLIRLAWAESGFGDNDDTYNPGNEGGIWKVASAYLDITQYPGDFPHLVDLHARILSYFSIDWMSVTRAHLEVPLFSALAARLYLTTLAVSIPVSINDQAQYWRQHYNHNESLSVATYINAVNSLEQVYACNGKLDLVIVLDGSGSMLDYFVSAKTFIAELVSRFSLQYIHVAFFVYDSTDSVHTIFPLNNTLTLAQMVEAIRAAPMPANEIPTNERPDLGIRAGIQEMRASEFREGAPQVIATFFDGGGNADLLRAAVSEAETFNINAFSLPTGNVLDENRPNFLITAGNDPTRILQIPPVLDGASMTQFVYKLNDQICRTSQNRVLNIGDVLLAGETRYYNYNLANATLLAYMKQGAITVYYSFTTPNPSSAIYEGFFNATATAPTEADKSGGDGHGNVVMKTISPSHSTRRAEPQLYVAVRGVSLINSYTLMGIAN